MFSHFFLFFFFWEKAIKKSILFYFILFFLRKWSPFQKEINKEVVHSSECSFLGSSWGNGFEGYEERKHFVGKSQHWYKRIPENWIHFQHLGQNVWRGSTEGCLHQGPGGTEFWALWLMHVDYFHPNKELCTLRGMWRPCIFIHFTLSS